MKKISLLLKILAGIFIGGIPMYMTYKEAFTNTDQFIYILACSIYLFFSGWGIEYLNKKS